MKKDTAENLREMKGALLKRYIAVWFNFKANLTDTGKLNF